MDPNAALEQIRAARREIQSVAEQIVWPYQGDRERNLERVAEELAELFQGLDEFLTHGGFLPSDWEGKRKAFTPEQGDVIAEALGDAYAYRNDSGERDEEDLEEYEREACRRYTQLATELGVKIAN